jgi:hypothetical protein
MPSTCDQNSIDYSIDTKTENLTASSRFSFGFSHGKSNDHVDEDSKQEATTTGQEWTAKACPSIRIGIAMIDDRVLRTLTYTLKHSQTTRPTPFIINNVTTNHMSLQQIRV